MKKKRLAEGAAEFDKRFDEGEDIHDIVVRCTYGRALFAHSFVIAFAPHPHVHP
jgi:hypothetical protein